MNGEYWERLHRGGGLRSVGQSALSDQLNRWLYRTGRRTLTRFTRDLDLSSLFEAGAGTGFWTSYWLTRGAGRVDGCDIVPIAVERLNDRFRGAGEFVAADLSAVPFPVSGDYPTVTAMNVLLHIIDDEGFEHALRNLAQLVRPGGHLLIADAVLVAGQPWAADTSRTRSLASFVAPLERHGLEFVRLAPTTVLGADPIEARSRLEAAFSRRWWRIVMRADRHRLGPAIGPLIYVMDPLALRTGWAPSGKFLLFRRPPSRSASA